MPRGDGTGPNGQGPQTGRAAGYCSGNDRPGFATGGFGRGMRRGGGMGRGGGGWPFWLRWGGQALADMARQDSPPATNNPNEVAELRRQLDHTQRRLDELEQQNRQS